ncbi:MAG: alanine--glyoxylate aminotransferase family protein [Lachnospiraceae bacterium]|nr:alanine--glyoxylate aminotransferase family protein [Lachnospiraceae bacterium]
MLNFTVGPVQSFEEVKRIGAQDVPYFRTSEFSGLLLESEELIKEFACAQEDARCVFLSGSGTASMEAAVANLLSDKDNVIVINGGSFGERFVELCKRYEIPHTEIRCASGKALTCDRLRPFEKKSYTALLVNLHETSTGVLYDLPMISRFCHDNGIFLVVDAVSSFLADEIEMEKSHIDVLLSGSQKALGCPPGISFLVLSRRALNRAADSRYKGLYLNLQSALKNMERGQTPYTPAVGTLLQIHARLLKIRELGGVKTEVERVRKLAKHFRENMCGLPLDIYSERMSNAMTAVSTRKCSAYEIFRILKNEYGIWVCPNGGELAEKVFRIGHIGNLTIADNNKLLAALRELAEKRILR